MNLGGKGLWPALALGVVVLGVLPVVFYQWMLAGVPTMSVKEAQERLAADLATVLVDVRTPEEFAARHVSGAVNWPLAQIEKDSSAIPPELQGKTLLLLCDAGFSSVGAARELGGSAVFNVEGGMQAWIGAATRKAYGGTVNSANLAEMRAASQPGAELNAFRVSPVYEQWAAVFSGFTLKPAYMLLALALAWILRRRRESDLTALRWGMLFFFAGEAFCYANWFVYRDASYLFEYLHSYGMVLSFGFGVFALFEGMDSRILGLSAPDAKCAAVHLCRGCIKYTDTSCGLRRVFEVVIPLCVVLACLPLMAEPVAVSYNTLINGLPYNYSHPVLHQLYETRVCPVAAIVLMSASWLVLMFKKIEPVAWAKVLFSAGLGFFAFGLLRLLLFAPFRDNLVWFGFWEEVTEFLGIVGVGVVLWIFRRGLFHQQETGPA